MTTKYEKFAEKSRKIASLQNTLSLLRWDQEVMMPPNGANARSEQIAVLSSLVHDRMTDPEYEKLLEELHNEELNFVQRRNVELTLETIHRKKKIPSKHVYTFGKAVSDAFRQWLKAREANDFNVFADSMGRLLALKLEEAEYVGYQGHIYNALMYNFDRGLTVTETNGVFSRIQPRITSLIQDLKGLTHPGRKFLNYHFEPKVQMKLSRELAKAVGYDFNSGRLDLAPHPFSSSMGPGDSRITTRFSEDDFFDGMLSSLHEAGHSIYEQGLPAKEFGLPSGQAVSLSIHESQSRLYENHVGRSMPFVKAFLPIFQKYFPDAFSNVSADNVFKALNVVQPSLIRTASDEVTYHLHIIIRYELERDMVEGKIKPSEAGDAWREKYKQYLGITVPDDNQGVLQDIHWSHGSFGYFPTYSLGSFYAAQFFKKATEDLPGLEDDFVNQKFERLQNWLRENIHSQGRLYDSGDLCHKVTGEYLNPEYYLKYINEKLTRVYGGSKA